jgi:hypothetical protein
VALNALSAIQGVARVPGWQGPVGHAGRERPIAIETTAAATSRCERLFTIHGTDALPLEEQCPSCVRKVILTKAEVAMAQRYVLSNWDASLLTF